MSLMQCCSGTVMPGNLSKVNGNSASRVGLEEVCCLFG